MIVFLYLFYFASISISTNAFAQMPFAICNGQDSADVAWICTLKNGVETGEENTVRCENSTKSYCRTDAGGDTAVPGFHSIPRDAWFSQASTVVGAGMIKCQCGCFTGDMNLLTTSGWIEFKDAAKYASQNPFRLAVLSSDDKLLASEPMSNKQFTVGPEDKDIIRIETENGYAIHLTDNHPVVKYSDNDKQMVQAKSIQIGDKLITQDGLFTEVTKLKNIKLAETSKNVYNVDTKSENSVGHIIIVNGLQMGDVLWQKRLSELVNRQENLYLASIK